MAIANALQLEAARATPTLSRFNYDAVPSLKSPNLSIAVYSVFADDTLLYAVTLTFDIWPWTFALYRLWRDKTLYQIWTQSSNPRRSYCDFNIWPYDLKHCIRVALGSRIIFTKFDLWQFIRAWIIAFYVDTLCHAVTLTFDPLTLKVRGTSSLTWSKSVRNLSEIKQCTAELLILFANFCTRYVTLWPWHLTS